MQTEMQRTLLGELIEECDQRNMDNSLTLDDVRGVSIEKKFIETKANMEGVSLNPYKVLKTGWFCYVTVTSRNGGKISLALYNEETPAIVSSSYVVFRSKDEDVLLPEYLYLLFNRSEFDRYSRFNSWGSARETFDFSEMCRIEIPLPSIEVQRELVAVYDGLQKIVAENESLIPQLEAACHAFVVDCKRKYSKVRLGRYIREINEKNDNLTIKLAQGVDVNMSFIPAKREAVDKESTRVVHRGQFAFNKVIKCYGTKLPIALRNGPDCIISGSYQVFEIVEKHKLLSDYLMLWMARKETQRYCGYRAWGSTRDVFPFNELANLSIPLPPIEIQRSIADVSHCLEEAKRIVRDTRELMKNLCPALVQKAAHSA